MKKIVNNLEDTKSIAKKISSICEKGDVILLDGTLGVGKTTFAKYFLNSLFNKKQEISSPTFNLVKTYEAEEFLVHHLDLYRIKDSDELYELGIEDILSEGVSLIEWPEFAEEFLNNDYLRIKIELKHNNKTLEDFRTFTLIGHGKWIKKLEDAMI